MKACRKCGVEKPLSDYYTHKQMADGRLNTCKECVKARVSQHRQDNLERVRAYDRMRGQDPKRKAKVRKQHHQYKQDPEAKAKMWAQSKEWREQNRQKRQAHIAVNNAIRDGRLKVQPCERCGYAVGVHGHHEDYSKPLDVIWLCRRCHGERHREINEERRRQAA